ncbi:putative F-box associated interaction domain-containing protein [Rosa chinensis]|uniref:Putative F-box associated interaction domain-containing protein n=1 Tax=Rosa chinensis TaxID=74649 RepID=A0A2P6QG03_ROSCH|nr:putative F-box associated interaction domain-containing protein [Rosa chinensis]
MCDIPRQRLQVLPIEPVHLEPFNWILQKTTSVHLEPFNWILQKTTSDSLNVQRLRYFGFGHLSATDDYKVIAKIEKKQQAEIFSSRANTWKTIQVPSDVEPFSEGFLFNEALHWISIKNFPNYSIDVVAFDLAKEEFRKIPLPTTLKNAAALSSFRGCLCVFDYAYNTAGSIYLWVMREYNMADAWTKLFNIKIPIPPENAVHILRPILVTETSTFLRLDMMINAAIESKLVRSVHHQEEKLETYMVSSGGLRIRDMIIFKESLLWLY